MGTHTYILKAFRGDGEEPTERDMFSKKFYTDTASCSEELFDDVYQYNYIEEEDEEVEEIVGPEENRFVEEFSCRELLIGDTSIWYDAFSQKKYPCMVSIDCLGELYTDVSILLAKNRGLARKVANLVSKVSGVKITLSAGQAARRIRRYYTPFVFSEGYTRPTNRRITIYLRSWENYNLSNISVRVSAILALLREIRIITGILSGSITNKHDVILELLKIARDRAEGSDHSYECYTLSGIPKNSLEITRERALKNVAESLSYSLNDDGSDWCSILFLALFFFSPGENELLQDDEFSGPVNYVESAVTKREFREFQEYIGQKRILRFFAKKLHPGKDSFSEEDLLIDEYREQAKVWLD